MLVWCSTLCTPAVLVHLAYINRCESCLVILEGFRQGGQTLYQKDFQRLARTITARCRDQQNGRDGTLTIETSTMIDPKWDSVGSIPKTFQDAITLTSLLGLRFIWIDSLCIIQNDKEDWATESAKMADIYQHVSLTLSATVSAGDSYGCFSASFNTSQRILFRRVLHFSEHELVWECRELSTCECNGFGEQTTPAGAFDQAIKISEDERSDYAGRAQQIQDDLKIRSFQEDEIAKLWKTSSPGLRRGSAKSAQNWILKLVEPETNLPPYVESDPWTDLSRVRECANYVFDFHRIVEQYSTLKLTKQTDRLPALSGLCKRIQHIRGKYAAGLWMESLAFDLLWRVERLNVDATKILQPSEDYCGPSWSWASVSNPVVYWKDIVNFFDASQLFRPPTPGQADMQQHKPFSRPTCLGRSLRDDCVLQKVAERGMNPFGRVAYAILKGEASVTTATLRYTYSSFWLDGTNKLDMSRYKLTLGADEIIELPFWADYALAAE
ncbi:hypothetical protein EJ07DRAFT_162921 [Lizonia empirigonia]|nr:hypothetical protein EJ07DRAFT_162921 [Lizonia empirigonia]